MKFQIFVKPKSKFPEVGGQVNGMLVVKVAESPIEGLANKAIVKLLASTFGVKVRDVTIVSGTSSRIKIIEIDGNHENKLSDLLEIGQGKLEL